jgi:CRP-like cAMP-binding protein
VYDIVPGGVLPFDLLNIPLRRSGPMRQDLLAAFAAACVDKLVGEMTGVSQLDCRNLLLRSMRREDFALIASKLNRVELQVGEEIVGAGQAVEAACFPEAGIISFSDILEDGTRVGIGHFGYEGFAGWQIMLGCSRSQHEARVTVGGGDAYRISAGDLVDACRASQTLRDLLLRFVQAFMVQLGRTIVSSLIQPVETRLCRWTLMAHDRVEGDEIKVTHDEIAVMLAVRRASVTDALHILEGEGLIRAHRGRVLVRNRDGLQRRAGETYGYYEREYSWLIAPFPRHGAAKPS